MSHQTNDQTELPECPDCGRRHEFHCVCKPYIDSTISPTPQRYALLHDGRGGYYIRMPDGTETRWIPDLCAELNGLHAQLTEARAERDIARREQNADERICAQRDQALRECDDLSEANAYLGEVNAELRADEARLVKERDEARANFNEACEANERIAKERDEARRQRDGWRANAERLESRINALDNTTPELSRLEIAARVMQGLAANPSEQVLTASPRQTAEWAMDHADALIAAAKETQP